MTHMAENYPEDQTKRSIANLLRVMRTTRVRTLLLDHHALRDREWRSRMAPVIDGGKEHDVAVMTCAEFLGKAVDEFEANRDALYGVPGANRDASGR